MGKIRIQKALPEVGVASRRGVEQMILDGRITVNGELVTSLPCFVDLAEDNVRVDGQSVRRRPGPKVYFLLNKPKGVVCTQQDPRARPRAVDLIPPQDRRVYCVGGLDADSTGLVLLTNDGELTQRLTHARHGVPRKYVAEVDGRLETEETAALETGVRIEGRRTAGMNVKVLFASSVRSTLKLELPSGHSVDIRRVLADLGHKVRKLKCVAIGPVTDRGIKIGHFRMLSPAEVGRLGRRDSEHAEKRKTRR